MKLTQYTFLNNDAVKRIIQNLKNIGYNKLASKINPNAKGYLRNIFDPEDINEIQTRELLAIAEKFELLTEV